jgi:fructokinase
MRTFITTLGECLIDFLPLKCMQGQEMSDAFRMCAGGSIYNVAMGVARLGEPTAFSCKVADDYFGRFLRTHIEHEHIDTRFLVTQKGGQTTLAFVAMEAGSPTFTFYGEGAADTLLDITELPAALFEETKILHVGSISLLRGKTPEAILAAAERLKGKALLSFDPNLRPDLVSDETTYRSRLQRIFALADVVKLSDVDLAWLNKDQTAEQAIQDLLAQGAGLVVVTRGQHGALAARAGGPIIEVPSFNVEFVDAVGAGDSFCAGLLTQLARHTLITAESLRTISDDDLRMMLRFAAATAALNCTKVGANPPQLAEVEDFLPKQSV